MGRSAAREGLAANLRLVGHDRGSEACRQDHTAGPAGARQRGPEPSARSLPFPLEIQIDSLQTLEIGPDFRCLVPEPYGFSLAREELVPDPYGFGLPGGKLGPSRHEIGE